MRFRFYLLFLLMDGSSLVTGFSLVALHRHVPFWSIGRFDAAGLILALFVAFTGSGFQPAMLRRWRYAARHSIGRAAGACLLVMMLSLLLRAPVRISPVDILTTLTIAAVGMVAAHRIVGRWATAVFRDQPLSLALIDDEMDVRPPSSDLTMLCATRLGLAQDVAHPLLLDRLSLALSDADIVYVACRPDRRRHWAMVLRGSDIPAKFLMPELEPTGAAVSDDIAHRAQMTIETEAMETRDRIVKRVFDLASALLLLVFFAPLLGIVAMLVKLDSSGPVFFVQQRVGRGNRLFAMIKFRSMYTASCDDDGWQSTLRGDSRVTPVGRLLRRTSMDELPQLFNVVRGDMSFVGPRPHALGSLAGDQPFWEVDPRYCDRHAYKPGLTGLAQVRGLRGATHRREDLIDRLQADLEYIDGWSVWRDLLILFATFKVVFHRNAY